MASKAHCTSHIVDIELLWHEINNRILCIWLELSRICVTQFTYMSCKCNNCKLEPKADSEIWDVVCPCKIGRTYDALASPYTKAARCQYPLKVFQHRSSTHQPFCQCLHQHAIAHDKY